MQNEQRKKGADRIIMEPGIEEQIEKTSGKGMFVMERRCVQQSFQDTSRSHAGNMFINSLNVA